MSHYKRIRGEKFDAIVAIGHAVERVETRSARESEFFGDVVAVGGIGRSRKRATAERTNVKPFFRVVQSSDVAQKHHTIAQKMMCERNRLSALKVRIPGHNRIAVFVRFVGERGYKSEQFFSDFARFFAHVQS